MFCKRMEHLHKDITQYTIIVVTPSYCNGIKIAPCLSSENGSQFKPYVRRYLPIGPRQIGRLRHSGGRISLGKRGVK
jgi:hypothetical protein